MKRRPGVTHPGARLAAALCLLLFLFNCFPSPTGAENPSAGTFYETARPSVTGALHTEGTSLAGADGNAVQLRGVSTHGLT